MFEPFQNFLKRAANHYGVNREINAAQVCHDFSKLVPLIFETLPDPAQYIKPAYFKGDILVINVTSPAFAQEVIMRKPQIIHEMNKKAGKEIIKNLRTQLLTGLNSV